MPPKSELWTFWNEQRLRKRARRAALGVQCEQCKTFRPNMTPAIVLPGQRCPIHFGWRAPQVKNEDPQQ